MINILEKIIVQKKKDLIQIKKKNSLNSIDAKIKSTNNYLDFKRRLINREQKNYVSIIGEIKKASPSAGTIVNDFDYVKIANVYSDSGVSCLSVLTEEKFFLGNLNYIEEIKKKIKLPVLAKDFFVDPYQVSYSKSFGCDCILIILSALSEKQSDEIYDEALKNKLSVIVEVHDEKEAEYALKYEEAIIGINNRNLKNLKISLNNSIRIQKKLVSHKGPLVSESGIKNKTDARYIYEKTGIKTFLIGESLLASGETKKLIEEILSITQ
jgi:indole-3-glycerol phosphate synthase|tara:strand:+ start:375 stop:1178 length:804 start_codon:yes stop_codon:yes gene_type:complete